MRWPHNLLIPLILIFSTPALSEDSQPYIVGSFSIVCDLVHEIAQDTATVDCLVGPDSDPHSYELTPQDMAKLSRANLVFVNGLGFEPWAEKLPALIKATKLVTTTALIKPLQSTDYREGSSLDPHAWQSLPNAYLYIVTIREALIKAWPQHRSLYESQADILTNHLKELDQRFRRDVNRLSAHQKMIMTTHDAFHYFGESYGIKMKAPLSINPDREPSPRDLAHIIRVAQNQGYKTIFLENMTNPEITRQLMREAGLKLGGILYSDALSPKDGPAPTYEIMMRTNFDKLLAAMQER